MTMEFSGPAWVERFPGSVSTADLMPSFRVGVEAFIAALVAGGARVEITATYRPAARAYLMHYACLIAGYRDNHQVFRQIAPDKVPAFGGDGTVPIDWTHGGDHGAALAAAVAMKNGFGIAFPAALVSNHSRRTAIDMKIVIPADKIIHDARGVGHTFPTTATDHHPTIVEIGKTFGVIALISDVVHWSADGH